MLVLTRRQGESLRIGNDNKITVCIIYKTQIKLDVNDSEVVTVNREEVVREIKGENVLSSASSLIDHIKGLTNLIKHAL